MARLRVGPVALEHRRHGPKRLPQDAEWSASDRSFRDHSGQRLPKDGLAVEQNLPLVREMPEEGALRHAGPGRDPGGGGPVVAVLAEQL